MQALLTNGPVVATEQHEDPRLVRADRREATEQERDEAQRQDDRDEAEDGHRAEASSLIVVRTPIAYHTSRIESATVTAMRTMATGIPGALQARRSLFMTTFAPSACSTLG